MNGHTIQALIYPPTPSELEQLEAHVQTRLNRKVENFGLGVHEDGLILTGEARSYFARQLAERAVLQASALPIFANEIDVVE